MTCIFHEILQPIILGMLLLYTITQTLSVLKIYLNLCLHNEFLIIVHIFVKKKKDDYPSLRWAKYRFCN